MPTPEIIKRQIMSITAEMIENSLCVQQTFPYTKNLADGNRIVSFKHEGNFSIVLKNISYSELYDELEKMKAFNIKMLDGSLLQMMYTFNSDGLESHRLAFLPSPYLEDYQNYPEIYEDDEIFADIIKKNIVPFPIRFDYDTKDGVFLELDHPKSHMTLGQYENCRIPVSAPLTPFMFCSFILRNFYNTAFHKYCDKLTEHHHVFPMSIFEREITLLHMQTPSW